MTNADARDAVAREALEWLGTPYHHHARIKGVGVDCAQLLIGVYAACAVVPAIDTGHYPVDWHLHRGEELFAGWLARYARPSAAPAQVGDVALFRFGRTYSHGAICVGAGLLVHSYIGRGVIVSRLNEEPLEGREVQVWSLFP